MNIKNIILIAVVIYIFIFPDKAKAEEITVYYLKDDDVYNDMLKQTFEVENTNNSAKKIFITLDKLFNIHNVNYVPQNTKILNIEKIGKNIYINVSGEILSYGGGSTYEVGLVRQLLYNIFQFKEVDIVSIFIDNEKKYLPEGTLIDNYKRADFYAKNKHCHYSNPYN